VAKLIQDLSVFLPVFNEQENIEKVILSIKTVMEKVASNWELVVVNDGSTDGSAQIVSKLEKDDRRIKLINHEFNQGYGAAISTGLYTCKYDWIAFIDSDGQFDFSEISNFIKKQNESRAELVIGYYKKRQVSFTKILTSKLWELIVFILFGLKVRDVDCGFKLISKKVIGTIPKLESKRGAFISSELLIKAKKSGFKIVEIPVTHYPRTKGVGTGRNLNVIIQSFIDLFSLWKKLNFG